MQDVCKEWSIKDDKLMSAIKQIKARYESVLKNTKYEEQKEKEQTGMDK